jgi:hypothetical protein
MKVRGVMVAVALAFAGAAGAQTGYPDLVATSVSFPPAVAQGSTTPVTVTVRNNGLTAATRAFNVSVALTRDGGVCTQLEYCDESDDDWFVGYASVAAGLAAGAEQTVTIQMSIPADFTPLAWNLFSVVDGPVLHGYGSVYESNEGNNVSFWGAILIVPGSTTLTVGIDIKPGSYPNSINLGSNGVVPVAILSSAGFDATAVDPLTVTLASSPVFLRGNGQPAATVTDVNGDGLPDLVVQVLTEALQLTSNSTTAALMGTTYAGQAIVGYDDVNVVP